MALCKNHAVRDEKTLVAQVSHPRTAASTQEGEDIYATRKNPRQLRNTSDYNGGTKWASGVDARAVIAPVAERAMGEDGWITGAIPASRVSRIASHLYT